MKLESWQSAEDKRRWKIVRTDDYTDVPGDIITTDEASGECCVQIAGGVAIVAALAVRSTLGDALPPLMSGHQEVPLQKIIPGSLCLLAMIALCCTIARRTVLDLWLSLAMYAWACDVMLNAVFNAGRFDFGWYAGRIFGFFAVSLVLCEVLVLTVAGRPSPPSARPPAPEPPASGQGADWTGR